MQQEVIVENKKFSLVKIQRSDMAAIYRRDNLYLRIGDPSIITHDLSLHEQMITYKFPVARIVSKGEHEDQLYFIEESLGDKHFGDIFAEDTKGAGGITQESFKSFLDISKRFAIAQLETSRNNGPIKEFAHGIHLEMIYEELPKLAPKVKEKFEVIVKKLSTLPYVITHGDFNPHNLYPNGVIDLESSFYGPAGYDLVTNIVHIEYFPTSTDYEFYKGYTFTDEQKKTYFTVMDTLYKSKGLPLLSSYLDDFRFCRAIWSAVKMDQYPKIQKFRYNMLSDSILSA